MGKGCIATRGLSEEELAELQEMVHIANENDSAEIFEHTQLTDHCTGFQPFNGLTAEGS